MQYVTNFKNYLENNGHKFTFIPIKNLESIKECDNVVNLCLLKPNLILYYIVDRSKPNFWVNKMKMIGFASVDTTETIFFCRDNMVSVCLNDSIKLTFRNLTEALLRTDQQHECIVCLESFDIVVSCTSCSAHTCSKCTLKLQKNRILKCEQCGASQPLRMFSLNPSIKHDLQI